MVMRGDFETERENARRSTGARQPVRTAAATYDPRQPSPIQQRYGAPPAPTSVLTRTPGPSREQQERETARRTEQANARHDARVNSVADFLNIPDDYEISSLGGRERPGTVFTPQAQRAVEVAKENAPERDVVDEKSWSEYQQRYATAFNKAMRRELTDEEWNRLNSAQQTQVRLNNDLVSAYDADMARGTTSRPNTNRLIEQLQLPPQMERRITEALGIGMGPTVRYGDLFDEDGDPLKADSPYQFGDTGYGVVPRATDERQRLVNSISTKLTAYTQQRTADRVEGERQSALAASQEYKFKDPQAKQDYEEAANALFDRNMLSTLTWAQAAESMRGFGYDPVDFQRYVRDRLQLMPPTEGMTTLEELDAWFGTR